MTSGCYRFDCFVLDPAERRLLRDGDPVELNGRYLDALALLVREQGRLVTKDRLLGEVWRGIPVTDEALTQCVKTLRSKLGDSASQPRFIETVPKHGYRFIAAVEDAGQARPTRQAVARDRPWGDLLKLGLAGTAGGGLAGLLGGLFYGFLASSQPGEGIGAASILLVLMGLTLVVALLGGAGVAFGIALSRLAPDRRHLWPLLGGAAGGLVIGAAVELLGMDAFGLLFGRAPGDMTGAAEGALLGAAVAAGLLSGRRSIAAILGGLAGALIPLLGGQLLGGSLDLLARSFPASRLRLDAVGALFGEQGFGPFSRAATGAIEGALFAGCVVAAMLLAQSRAMAKP